MTLVTVGEAVLLERAEFRGWVKAFIQLRLN